MARLAAFVALFIALIARASAYTTVVTTIINNEQSCQTEVQRMQMRHCMQWMQRGMAESFLRSAVANMEEHQKECCMEMRKVRPDCHCDMMRRMMQQMQSMETMKSMFNKCGMEFPMECASM